ncbi:MAG: type II secretion system minor pseudopilin GspK [Magnetococcales bacterium]|nr:type II secretion system minor pseudopilin GspK [Magnetococcales bacterium]
MTFPFPPRPGRAGHRASQRGAALITALLIVALATVTLVSMTSAERLSIRRLENSLNRSRAQEIVLGGELWARTVLGGDGARGTIDHLGEEWAAPISPIAVDGGGTVAGRVEDLQARFNLNNLAPEGRTSPFELERFQRLLALLELKPDLAYAIIDWIDTDSEWSGPGGAETLDYQNLDPPYRPPNRFMTSVSELRMVKGVDDAIYGRLAPLVTALPGYTPFNVNTAPRELLMIIADRMRPTDVERVLEQRQRRPYESIEKFIMDRAMGRYFIGMHGLTVESRFFLTTVEARFQGSRVRLSSQLLRQGSSTQVLQRGFGGV